MAITLEAFIDQVQDDLEDPGGFATFSDAKCSIAAEKAVRYLGSQVGRIEARLAVDMVIDVPDYVLPAATQIKAIKKLRIIPENGNEPGKQGLKQIDLFNMPINPTFQSSRDPDRFVTSLNGGANEDRYMISLWPSPCRTASEAIIIDYEVDFVFVVANQATTQVPYPPQFTPALNLLTKANLLSDKDNQADKDLAKTIRKEAQTEIEQNRDTDAISKTESSRRFP